MVFNKITGTINSIPLSTYQELIRIYVEKVKKVEGVKSIIQMGSFTTPGLSDIDLIIIVDNKKPPKWEDISIKQILKDQNGFEVVAHDVFVYSEKLSKYIEGLFYIDRKKILFGKDIGRHLSEKMIKELKLILSFEYTIHRLETLVMLTSLPSVNIRDILLFISTLRHTYKLLNSFDIISIEECNTRIDEIEKLRSLSLNNSSEKLAKKLNDWITPSFIVLYNSILQLGQKLEYSPSKAQPKWILNYKKLIFTIDEAKAAAAFFVKNDFYNKIFKGKILIEAMPSTIKLHIIKYEELRKGEANDLSKIDSFSLRYKLAVEHKRFLTFNKYPLSGSYIIINNKTPSKQDKIKFFFLTLFLYF